MGVIDGHDVGAVRKALKSAFEAERPVVVHVATVKGKGFAPAEDGGLEGMEKWHAAKPKSIAGRIPSPAARKVAGGPPAPPQYTRSEEHTSELQSRQYLVCRLLLEKKKNPR